ncbi:MAG: hypothetical protein PUI95_11010 [Eubacteriales bacterium]|nr:hypothetical protein [Eubacteriales bacterium]
MEPYRLSFAKKIDGRRDIRPFEGKSCLRNQKLRREPAKSPVRAAAQ